MAKKLESEKTVTESARIPNEEQFHKLLKKLNSAESEMSEAKGRMGSAVEQAVASTNLHTDALRICRKYIKKSPAQAASFYCHLLAYWQYAKLGENDMLEPEVLGGPTEPVGNVVGITEAA